MTKNNKEECPYCHINIPLEKHDETLFLWHLNGHGEEKVMTNLDKLIEEAIGEYQIENSVLLSLGGFQNLRQKLRELAVKVAEECVPEERKECGKESEPEAIYHETGFNACRRQMLENITKLKE